MRIASSSKLSRDPRIGFPGDPGISAPDFFLSDSVDICYNPDIRSVQLIRK
jgi:hypothetical protein